MPTEERSPLKGQVRPLVPEESKDETCDSGNCDITTSSSTFFQMTMSVTLGVFIYEGIAYNLMFLSRVLPALGKADHIPFFFLLFNVIWTLALVAYLRAFATEPGRVPLSWHDFVKDVGPALPVVPSTARWAPGKATYCRKCSIPRPERAHHCNVSGFCVLRMDHYCPWISNCVGLGNYKFFLQLVVYGTLCSFVGIATSITEFVLVIVKLVGIESDVWQANLQITDMIAFVVFEGLAIFLSILLVPMLYTHVPLACNNMTAIECNYTNMENPYHLGSKMANLEQVLGSFGPDWFFPVKPFDPIGDGVSFPRYDDPVKDLDRNEGEHLWRLRYQLRQAGDDLNIFKYDGITHFGKLNNAKSMVNLRDFPFFWCIVWVEKIHHEPCEARPNPQEQEFDPLRTLTHWFIGDEEDASPVNHANACGMN